MSATELLTTTPVKAVRVRTGAKCVVQLLDANGGVVCRLGGNRAERARAVFCRASTTNAGVNFGRPTEARRFFDAGLRADPAQAAAHLATHYRHRDTAAATWPVNERPTYTDHYAMVLLVEDAA